VVRFLRVCDTDADSGAAILPGSIVAADAIPLAGLVYPIAVCIIGEIIRLLVVREA